MSMMPKLKRGSVGTFVKLLQMDLNGLSLNYNGFVIDSYFGQKTEDVVKNFQDRFQLNSDGVVGPITWKVLLDNVKAVQRLLNVRGYSAGAADGWYGTTTSRAVGDFQSNHGLAVDGILNPRTRQQLFNSLNKDHFELRPSSGAISSLHPHVANLAQYFLSLTRTYHLNVRITRAFRSWAEQDQLYARGRTVQGSIVTNAQGGNSYHNWGLAFDAAPFEDGKPSSDIEKYKQMGYLGQQAGLEWAEPLRASLTIPIFNTHTG